MKESTDRLAEKLTASIRCWPGSQRELSKRIGVTPQMLNQYLRGSMPKPLTLVKLSRELNVQLDWLLNDEDGRIDVPPHSAAWPEKVKGAPYGVLIDELKRQYDDLAKRLNPLIDRAEDVPWEHVALWLLCKPRVKDLPPIVESCLTIFRDIHDLTADFEPLATRVHPPSGLSAEIEKLAMRTVDRSHPTEIRERLDGIRQTRPGWIGIGHYMCNFDQAFMEQNGLGDIDTDPESKSWNDLRAWLLAQAVTHESLVNEKKYEPIIKQLRKMRYIDDEGKPRNFGDSTIEMGSFEVDPPE